VHFRLAPIPHVTGIMRRLITLTFLGALVVSAALQAQLEPPASWRIAAAPAELHDAISRADLVVTALQDAMQRELAAGLSRGGPALAVQSCHVDVMGVIERVERRKGVTAGRTSERLRNPANRPPPWAAALVAAQAGRRARDIDGYAVDLGDAVGVLRPIVQRPMCATCHGPAQQIEPQVHAVLAARYPSDRAIGFREGDLRGWFWVRVPKYRE
jgi:hypothetical protein